MMSVYARVVEIIMERSGFEDVNEHIGPYL